MSNKEDSQSAQFGTWQFHKVSRNGPASRKDRLVRFLSRPLLLEESGPPRVLLHLLSIAGLLVVLAIGWAGVTSVTETAITRGQIMPSGSVRLLEHLEGGIVSEILVQDGQVVEKDQPLVRLKNLDSLAELQRLRAQEAALALRAERQRAFVLGREADFSDGADYPELMADQRAILELQIEARDSQRAVHLSRIEQRKSELAGFEEQRENIEAQIEITSQQAEMRRNLVQKGLDSQVNLLDVERRVTEIQGELVGLMSQVSSTREALHEAKSSLVELDASLRNEALNEMGEMTAQLAEVRQTMIRLEDKVERLTVTAPVGGIVKGLLTRTIGSAVTPGEPIVEIVPMDETLVAEVQILPRDVGHMRIGQRAKVKITAYDVARFGVLEGELQHVSASTFQDEEGEPYYKGIIALAHNHMGDVPGRHLVLPGMVVDADINTGTKTLLQYLLKPVYRAFDSAFHER